MDGTTNLIVVLATLLIGGGGITAFLTWRTQSRSQPRRDAVEERRMDLEEQAARLAQYAAEQERNLKVLTASLAQSESTNRILQEALDFFKEELGEERDRHAADIGKWDDERERYRKLIAELQGIEYYPPKAAPQ